MLTSSGGRSILTVADRGEGGGKICQNLADVICERSLMGCGNPNNFNCFWELISGRWQAPAAHILSSVHFMLALDLI